MTIPITTFPFVCSHYEKRRLLVQTFLAIGNSFMVKAPEEPSTVITSSRDIIPCH